jgi:hypothetical protein
MMHSRVRVVIICIIMGWEFTYSHLMYVVPGKYNGCHIMYNTLLGCVLVSVGHGLSISKHSDGLHVLCIDG